MSEPGAEKDEETVSALRRRAEMLLSTKDEEISRMPARNIRALVHELQVHEIELQMQNEELRQAQLELTDARDRYGELYEFSPVGYLTIDAGGVVRGANLTAAKMLRVERGLLNGAKFDFFAKQEDRNTFSKTLAEVFRTGEKRSCEHQMLLADRSAALFRLESTLPDESLTGEAVCFTALIDITAQREAHDLLLEQQSYRVSEAEKTRIARELHDDLGSMLKGLEVHALILAKKLEAGGSSQANDARKIAGWLEDAVAQARDLAVGLNEVTDPDALYPSLKRLAEFAREANFECHLSLPETPIEFADMTAANHLYRIAQEAVHNAVRHSGGKALNLTLQVDRGEVLLEVCDNGCGFNCDAVSDESLGLQIMRYRAKAIHGTLTISASRPSGTRLDCRVPLAGTYSI